MNKFVFITCFLFVGISLYSQEMGLKESKEFSNVGDYVRQAEFSPYRSYYAFSIGNNTLRVYDRDWEMVFEHHGNPKAVGGVFAFSPDEKYLAYGRYKGNNDIAIIRLEDLKVVQVLNRHSDYVTNLNFSHDGKSLVSTSSDKSLVIWKLEDETFIFSQFFDEFESSVDDASFNYNDNFLVTGDTRGNILILERKGNRYEVWQEFQYRRHAVETIVFNPKRNEFVTGSLYGLRKYVLEKNKFVLTDSLYKGISISFPVYWSPDGDYLAFGNYQSAIICKVDENGIKPADYVFRHMDNVFGGSFSEDGEFFSTFSSDQRVIIWEIEKIKPSDKSLVVSWLRADLSLAQRRALTPGSVERIIKSIDSKLPVPRNEFETSVSYEARMSELADKTLGLLQQEMERQYDVSKMGDYVKIPVQGIVSYNADLEIYKIRFMETHAGVSIPIPAAKRFKDSWKGSWLRVEKSTDDGKSSFTYKNFQMYNPSDKSYYEVTPLENPFHLETEVDIDRAYERTRVKPGKNGDHSDGTTYALMIASNVYDYFSDLVNPVLDARTIGAELEENYGVVTEIVINPTLSETASKIREFASRDYKPNDNLMVFFAGHGIYDEVFKEGYVISRDSKMDDLGKTSYLSHSNLRTMINNINCPHIFLVMDVCFGGTFDPHLASIHRGASVYGDISVDEFVERKLKYKTRLYLTSGGKEYVPDGRPGFHSPFARRFIESLRHYGGDDGVLTTSEILQFVEKVNPQPRFGEFGDNEPGSDFIFVIK